MKKLFSLSIIILLLFTLYSCTKNNTETGLLVGNWTVINDSTLNTNAIYSLSAGNSGVSTNNYNGEPCGATLNFNSNGILITTFSFCIFGFGPTVDSANFIIKDNQVAISIVAQGNGSSSSFNPVNPVAKRTYSISNLTANTATLTFQIIHTPLYPSADSGIEIINLKK
jgi:hypothetical protein